MAKMTDLREFTLTLDHEEAVFLRQVLACVRTAGSNSPGSRVWGAVSSALGPVYDVPVRVRPTKTSGAAIEEVP